MLIRNILMRFAFSDPPLRERRELLFADNKKPVDPRRQSEEQESSIAPAPKNEATDIREVTQGTHGQVAETLRSIDTQEVFAALNAWNFDELPSLEEALADGSLQQAAEEAGILRILLNRKDALDANDPRALLDAILIADEAEKISPDAKKKFLQTLLEQSPHVTLALTHALGDRLQTYEEQQRILENCQQDVGQAWSTVHGEAVKIAKRMPTRGEDGRDRPYAIQDALKKLRTSWRAAFVSPDLTRPREILQNASDAIRTMEEYGARYWGSASEAVSPQDDAQRQAQYLRNIREQMGHLLSLLHAQLQAHGTAIVNLLVEGDALIPADGPIAEEARKSGAAIVERLIRTTDKLPQLKPESLDRLDVRQMQSLIADASSLTQSLLNTHRDAEKLLESWRQGNFSEETIAATDNAALAKRFATGSARMDLAFNTQNAQDAKTSRALRELRPGLQQDPEYAASLPGDLQARYDLIGGREQTIASIETESASVNVATEREIAARGIAEWTQKQDALFSQEQQRLLTLLDHPVCRELRIPSYVAALSDHFQKRLDRLQRKPLSEELRREICQEIGLLLLQTQKARSLLEKLDHAVQTVGEPGNTLVQILSPEEFIERGLGDEKTRGCTVGGTIYLRSDLSPQERQKKIKHEKAHAILWILTEGTLLFPALISDRAEALTPENMQILERRGKKWGITREEVRTKLRKRHPELTGDLLEQRTEQQYQRELTEEAVVRRSLLSENPQRRIVRQEQDALDAVATSTAATETPENSHYFVRREQDDDDEPLPEPGSMDAEDMASGHMSGESHSSSEDLDDIDGMIMKIQSFGEAYPSFKNAVTHAIGTEQEQNKPTFIIKELRRIHRTGCASDGTIIPDPDRNESFYQYVQQVKKYVKHIADKVAELDKKALDELEHAKKTKKTSISEKLGVQWLCILDIIRIWKELKEDITGIWTSIQDQKTAEAKANLYKHLPSTIPGTNIKIPILGKYTERLPHYAERRKNQLELERVKKWEDSFKNLDSEELLELIGATPTKDQLRASIELLVNKGLMNWGDRRIWKALNEKADFKMPIGPCARDEILRDMWLHKLISNIWGDRDMFDEWKSQNDKNYDSHKSAYTHSADNLSNIAGQLGNSLESILSQFVRNTDPNTGKPTGKLPEEVNPHHYEEILHYAMRNGKMSMEQKIFYLVQGVRYRLIGIERLRVLAGQKGDLLTKFPLLDYFYQRHNTYAEVSRLGEMLDESKADDDPIRFKPGSKTTMFLRLIVAKDDGVIKRVNKATTRKMEEVDHEDVPYILTDVNWNKMKNLIGNVSGDRWKVTNQGMQNTYVGFNEKFKIFAMVAQMEQEGTAVFSDEFVRSMAESAAAYVFYDNQVVRAGMAKENLSNLAWNEINDQVPVSSGGNLATAQYRNRMRDFTQALVQAVGITDADLAGDNVRVADMIASEQRDRSDVSKKNNDVVKASGHFCQLFEERLKANPDVLKRMLREWQGGSLSAGKQFLDWKTDTSGKGQVSREQFERDYQKVMMHG